METMEQLKARMQETNRRKIAEQERVDEAMGDRDTYQAAHFLANLRIAENIVREYGAERVKQAAAILKGVA